MSSRIRKAIEKDDAQTLRRILTRGNANTVIDGEPLVYAAAWHGSAAAVQAIIDAGGDVNQTSDKGEPPLTVAARRGFLPVVQSLLANGARVDAVSRSGLTALAECLIKADSRKYVDIVDALLAAGASSESAGGDVPLLPFALTSWCVPGIVTRLIDHGANANAIYPGHNATPLHLAVEARNLVTIQELLAAGADPTLRAPASSHPWSQLTPLEFAIQLKLKKVVTLLESHGSQDKATRASKSRPPAKPWDVLAQRVTSTRGKLRPGVRPEKIAACGAKTGLALPKEVVKFFMTHNGQAGGAPAIHSESLPDSGYRLLSLREAVQEWNTMQELATGGDFADQTPAPAPGIKPKWWHVKWFPFASNDCGDLVCFDCDPAKGGKKGQVIEFLHESPKRSLLGSTPAEFLEAQATE